MMTAQDQSFRQFIGFYLLNAREDRGLTPANARFRKVGLSVSDVLDIEKGKRKPTKSELLRLLQIYFENPSEGLASIETLCREFGFEFQSHVLSPAATVARN